MNRPRLGLSLALCAAPAMAIAQSAAPTVGEVVVTASRIEGLPAATPYAVTVLPANRSAPGTSVADALATHGEIYVQAPGGRSGIASIFLRGSDPNFTAVLFDGVPLNNPTNTRGGSVNVSELGAADFDRIEIVDGPASSLYGSGALAGVVNMIVPGGAARPQVRAVIGAGSQRDYSALLRVRAPLGGGYGGSLSLGADDDGDGAPGSSFRSHTLTGKIAPLDAAQSGRVVFRLSATEARAFPDSSGGLRLAKRRSTDSRKTREALIGADHPVIRTDNFRLDVSASWLARQDATVSPGVAGAASNPFGIPAGHDDTRYDRGVLLALGRFDLGAWRAATGLEAQRETARSTGALNFGVFVPSGFSGDRTTRSGFAEISRATPRWVLNAGARVDGVDGLGSHATARFGLRYNIPDRGFSLRASIGDGFKAPSFYALGNPFVGNPRLVPEKSRAAEAGIMWTGAAGDSAALTVFRTRFDGLIDFIPGPPPRLENRNVVISKGASASLTKALARRLSFALQVQYADTRDAQSGARLLNRPLWTTVSTLSWIPVDTLTISGRYGSVSERDDYSIPSGGASLPGYGALSLDAAWAFRPDVTARIVVENTLNDRHEDAIGFPSPGRRARLLLSRDF